MATYGKDKLSGSTNGKQIAINAVTSGSATTVHTAVAGTTNWDEIYAYAANNNSASVTCSMLWGGVTEPDDLVHTILNPGEGRKLIVDGKLLNNTLVVKAYASNPGSVVLDGFVNRITA